MSRPPTTITLELIEEIEDAFEIEGLSYAEAEERFVVCRKTLWKIREGTHPLQTWMSVNVPYERCPKCGGKVKLPCLLCRRRNQKLLREFSA